MADVNYLAYAQAMGNRNEIGTGLSSIGATLDAQKVQQAKEAEQAQQRQLRDLQSQHAQQGIEESKLKLSTMNAERGALIDQYGTQGQTDPYSQAVSFQNQETQDKTQLAEKQKQSMEKAKFAMDGFGKISDWVSKGTMTPEEAGTFYHTGLKTVGIDLDSAGVKMSFKQDGGYYSGPLAPDALVMVDGKPQPYGSSGIVDGLKVVGSDPQTHKPIFEFTKDAKFKEPIKQPETWGEPYTVAVGGKRAMVQKSTLGQIRPVVQDTSTTVKVSTGEKKERDLPTGIQDKLSQKLEIFNDWSTLKAGFKPEFMPKTPIKSIGEFQISLNKIFGNNQPAVDWWTQYFDARNIILKERSGAAVMEPEFKRFEQGTIAANTNAQSVINYLDRSSKKYKQHVDSYLEANRKNHPESVKAFEDAYGYAPARATASPPRGVKSAKDPLGIL